MLLSMLGVIRMNRIDIQKEVNPHFKSVWISKKPYNILRGGRNSFKSSVIALKLVFMLVGYIMTGRKANVVIIRKVANTIRDSVFLKIQWALGKFFLLDQFSCTVSPFKITHRKTGSTFYFYGQDDFQKLKSNDIGNIIAVWVEEAAEFNSAEEFDQMKATFMRQKPVDAVQVQFFYSYNPPRNPYHWINEWTKELEGHKDYLIHSSSYKDDALGFVTQQMIDEINRIKENDYDYYLYLYEGLPVGFQDNVYNVETFRKIVDLPSDDYVTAIFYSLDGGHAQSATTVLCLGLTAKQKVVLLDTYYYSPAGKSVKLAPSQLSTEVHKFISKTLEDDRWKNAQVINRTIDSAEAALRNQYYLDYQIRWNPVAKKDKQTMIDFATNLFAQGRFYYLDTESNKIFYEEHKHYRYKEGTAETDNPFVIKEDDHTCDAFQYFCVDNASILGIAV